jgi:Family of unknown function (DUF6011)
MIAVSHLPSADYLVAGKATFTVEYGNHQWLTYRIIKKDPKPPYQRTTYFLRLMEGSSNLSYARYVGIVDPDDGTLISTRKSDYLEGSEEFDIAAVALGALLGGDQLPKGWNILRSNTCGRCGKALTTPESIESGIGPECARFLRREEEE